MSEVALEEQQKEEAFKIEEAEYEFFSKNPYQTLVPFGKYEGKTLAYIEAKDHPYFRWIAKVIMTGKEFQDLKVAFEKIYNIHE